jgi:5-methylcytosine-specific restriction endonuclease McrA
VKPLFLQRNKKKRRLKPIGRPFLKQTKEQWAAEYLTPEWSLRRRQILCRDRHKCTKCGRTDYLQVHHTLYDGSLHVWEYTGDYLITMCHPCHKAWHANHPIKYSKRRLPKFKLDSCPPISEEERLFTLLLS